VKRQAFLCAIVFFTFCAAKAQGEVVDHAQRYHACMAQVHQAPERAFDAGLAWKSLGGGEAAEHCIGAALIGMKRYATGARRLEELANSSRRPKEFKAQILAQAAQGWFLGNDIARARAVLSTAIELSPQNSDLYVDRAHVRASRKHYADALSDLNRALELDVAYVEAYVFRGTIYRLSEDVEKAWSDIELALDLEPANPEALLERGMLYRLEGNDAQARRDWMAAIEVDPEGEIAQTARLNLERMDVKQEP